MKKIAKRKLLDDDNNNKKKIKLKLKKGNSVNNVE